MRDGAASPRRRVTGSAPDVLKVVKNTYAPNPTDPAMCLLGASQPSLLNQQVVPRGGIVFNLLRVIETLIENVLEVVTVGLVT